MAKKPTAVDDRQMSLLDLLQRSQELRSEESTEGNLNIRERLRRSMCMAIKRCPLDRWEIAGEMSHLLGEQITKYQLDSWTSESKEGHRPPAEYIPAFCKVTGSREPLEIMNEVAGAFCLPGPEALRAEIQRLSEEESRLRAEKKKRQLFLQEIESR